MRIGIVSDVHDNLANLQKVLNYLKENKIKQIFCLGDIGNLEIIAQLSQNFAGKIYFVCGNVEKDQNITANDLQKLPNIIISDLTFAKIKINNTIIGICHRPSEINSNIKSDKFSIIFYGHTHKPDKKMLGSAILLNPGNIAGIFYAPTFAIWNSNNNQYKLLLIDKL